MAERASRPCRDAEPNRGALILDHAASSLVRQVDSGDLTLRLTDDQLQPPNSTTLHEAPEIVFGAAFNWSSVRCSCRVARSSYIAA